MSQDSGKPAAPRGQQVGVMIGIVVAIVGFQLLAPEKTEPGFDFTRVLWAGVVGAVGAVLGGVIGRGLGRS